MNGNHRSGRVARTGDQGPSLRQVAARAGVSVSTVSRALRHDPVISAPTRALVDTALDELRQLSRPSSPPPQPPHSGPAPQGSSRAGLTRDTVRESQTPLIGVLVPEHGSERSEHYLPESTALGAVRAVAEARGYGVVLASYTPGTGEATYGDRLLAEGRLAGALVVRAHRRDDGFEALRRSGVPFVVVNRLFAQPFAPPHVGVDHQEVGRLATEHLLDLGHQRLAFVRFPSTVHSQAPRFDGYLAALRARGLEPDTSPDESTVVDAGMSVADVREAVAALAARYWGPEADPAARLSAPTALLVLSDRHALTALRELHRAGVQVPEDVSVIGADDGAEAEAMGLTTVRVPWMDMARIATESLLAIVSVRGLRKLSIALDPSLVVRTSTAPPASPVSPARPKSMVLAAHHLSHPETK